MTDPLKTFALCAFAIFWAMLANAMVLFAEPNSPKDKVRINWQVGSEDVESVRDQLHFEGETRPDMTTIDDTKALPLAYFLVGTTSLAYLAETIVKLYIGVTRPGLIVDATGEEVILKPTKTLMGGQVQVIGKSGTATVFQDGAGTTADVIIKAFEIFK